MRLAHSFPELDMTGGTIVEPNDTPLDSRHLDMVLALQTLSDKPYMGSVTSGPNAADTIHITGWIRCHSRRAAQISVYVMKPKPIPFVIEYVNGIITIVRSAGMPTAGSRHEISVTPCIMK